MGLGKGSGRGGRREGAGRPRKPRPLLVDVSPAICEALTGIRVLIEAQGARLEAQSADIARLQQQRRDEGERGPLILRRLTELERLGAGRAGPHTGAAIYPSATARHRVRAGGAGRMTCRRCGRIEEGPCRFARIRARKRQKRCYELAGRGICENDGAAALLLVHGLVSDPTVGRYDHAWLLDPRTCSVYDPVADRCFTEAEYRELKLASVRRVYSHADVCQMTITTGHFGPW
jgi:hypothetical protein